MKSYAKLIALAAALAASSLGTGAGGLRAQAAMGADEILARMDSNQSYRSIAYSGRMEITIGGETRYKTMDSVASGTDKAFSEFTNPEDRGTRYLKLAQELWIYFPKEQDTVKISGHLLKEGMMGSDVSYEDALESQDYKAKYVPALKGREEVDGRDCYVVELSAKPQAKLPRGSSPAAYDRRVLRIDSERFVCLSEEMYARSGKLLKVSHTLETAKLGDRWFPVKSEYVSKLRSDTRTVFTMSKIQLDLPLDAKRFTMAALKK
jgi:outer membrane lipoprotein-sorting protein